MAFDVTPTSGEGPYLFTADVNRKALVNGVYYKATVRSSGSTSNCPSSGNGAELSEVLVQELLKNGQVSYESSVPVGNCTTFTLRLIGMSTNVVVSQASVSVNNL